MISTVRIAGIGCSYILIKKLPANHLFLIMANTWRDTQTKTEIIFDYLFISLFILTLPHIKEKEIINSVFGFLLKFFVTMIYVMQLY